MNKAIIQFIACALLGLGIGYVVFDVIPGDKTDVADSSQQTKPAETSDEKATDTEGDTTTVSAEESILQDKGCLGCHAVSDLNLQGGATGPDLSDAYVNVEGKHGKPINQFLKEPTSAVMASVIGGSPLSDEEITKIVDVLKEASEVN